MDAKEDDNDTDVSVPRCTVSRRYHSGACVMVSYVIPITGSDVRVSDLWTGDSS